MSTAATAVSVGQLSARPLEKGKPVEISNGKLVRWMLRFIAPVKLDVFWACLWLVVAIVAGEIAIADTLGRCINAVEQLVRVAPGTGFWTWYNSGASDAGQLRHETALLAVLITAFCFFRYSREVSNMKMSMRMVYYLREAVYDKLQRVGFGFHDSVSTGQLINRALSDLQNVRQFVMSAVLAVLDIGVVCLGYIVLLAMKNATVALLALVPLPIWIWYILRFSRQVQPVSKSVMEAGDRNVSIISENVQGVHVVKAFATEKLEIGKYNSAADEFFVRTIRRIRMFANFTPVIRSIATLSHLGLYLIASLYILDGQLKVGDFTVISIAVGTILGRLQQVDMINQQYQAAIVSARRLYEVLHAPATVPEKPEALPLPAGNGTVRFEHVTFGYNPEKPVLHDVTFEIPGGSIVALVGPTGSGKSTLVNLIARFYDPQQGRVLIDGVDLRDATLSSVRTQVAVVFQETYLFSDTIEANIAYGRPGTKGGEVEAAARLAQAHEFIENLPKGYSTVLAERGSSLSGGQRQRLAIARAILFNPRVLILDDATASVDPETEDLINRALNFVMTGKTTFLIAHRISTVKRADLVMVIENGRITQVGTHEQLMRSDGHYREIAEAQLYGDDERHGDEHPSAMRRSQDMTRNEAARDAEREKARVDTARPQVGEGGGR